MTSSQRLLKRKAVKAQKLRWQVSAARTTADKTANTADAAKAEFKKARKTFKHAKKAAKEARKLLKTLSRKLKKISPVETKPAKSKPRTATAAKPAEAPSA